MTLFQSLFEKTDKAEFEFSALIRDAWHQLIHAEQDAVSISFDLENDDPCSKEKPRTIDTGILTPGGDHYRVLAQPCMAGGDWQSSVAYFRCQLLHGRSRSELFIVIPSKDEGNLSLVPGKEKDWVACDNNDPNAPKWKDIKWPPLWDALKKHATERVKMLEDQREEARMYHDYEIYKLRRG